MVISVKRILFQGDSITDMYRVRDLDHYAGCGYATLVSAQLGYENPGEYTFINRGIGGDRSIDILARIKKDAINLKPDYMSIFVGVNDAWAEIDTGNGGKGGTAGYKADDFRAVCFKVSYFAG